MLRAWVPNTLAAKLRLIKEELYSEAEKVLPLGTGIGGMRTLTLLKVKRPVDKTTSTLFKIDPESAKTTGISLLLTDLNQAEMMSREM